MGNCIFCKIGSKEVASPVVYEDELFLGFVDSRPLNPGHTLVIPKAHSETFLDMSADEYEAMMRVAHTLAKKVHTAFPTKRLSLFTKGFGVAHTHVHLIPLNADEEIVSGKFGLAVPEAPLHEREAAAEKIRNA